MSQTAKNILQYAIIQLSIQFCYLFSSSLGSNLFLILLSIYTFTAFMYVTTKGHLTHVSLFREIVSRIKFYFSRSVTMTIVFFFIFFVTYVPLLLYLVVKMKSVVEGGIENNFFIQLTWVLHCLLMSYATCFVFINSKTSYVSIIMKAIISIVKNWILSLISSVFLIMVLIVQIYCIREISFISEMRLMISIPISFIVFFLHDRIK